MTVPDTPQPHAAQSGPGRRMCDHICLLPDGHVEQGVAHQYGYELPSPREAARERDALAATLATYRELLDEIGSDDRTVAGLSTDVYQRLMDLLLSDTPATEPS